MSRSTKFTSSLALAALIAATPAMLHAQTTDAPMNPVPATNPGAPAPTETAPAPTDMAQPNTTDIPASEPTTQPTQPAPQAPAQSAQAPVEGNAGNAQVVAFVDQQFPQADADGDGSLSPTEFQPWIKALKSAELQSSGGTVDEAEVTTYASNAFATADADGNKLITKDELTQFLSG